MKCRARFFAIIVGHFCLQANELLLGGRKLTAIEAYQIGLVSQVFWPTSMMQEVIPRIQNMASCSSRVSQNGKNVVQDFFQGEFVLFRKFCDFTPSIPKIYFPIPYTQKLFSAEV